MISKDLIKQYTRTPGVRNEIDEIFTTILFIQRLYGNQILDPNWSWSRYCLKNLCTLLLLTYVIIGTIEVLKNAPNITIMAEAVYTLTITACFCVKYALFIKTKNQFQTVYLEMKTTLYDAIKEESKEKGDEVLKKGKLLIKLLFIMILVPNVAYWLTALWFYVTGARVTLSRTTSILMPMTSPTYELGLSLHMIYLFEMAFTILVIDVWFVCFMYFFCIASNTFETILMVDAKYAGESNKSYAKRLNERLRKFYKRHAQLMEYLNILIVMYKWLTLIPLYTALICTCLILLLMSEGVSWSFATNMLPVFTELLTYNWLGEQIQTQAENLSMTLLDFDWLSLELKDKKSYFIIVCYMSKKFGIKTAVGEYLSFVTMSTVLKASYQAFAVLKTMED